MSKLWNYSSDNELEEKMIKFSPWHDLTIFVNGITLSTGNFIILIVVNPIFTTHNYKTSLYASQYCIHVEHTVHIVQPNNGTRYTRMLIENVSWYSKMSNMILVCLTHKMAPGQGYRHLILGKG